MSTDLPQAIPLAPRPISRAGIVLSLFGLAAAIAGGVMFYKAGGGTVETIRVTKHSMLPDAIVGTPDFYLLVGTADKQQIETEGYTDTPIGNGLDFKLPMLQPLENIVHIELMDTDVGTDDMRDRVDVTERIARGQDYQFELLGPADPRRTAGIATLAAGGLVLIIGAVLLLRSLAI